MGAPRGFGRGYRRGGQANFRQHRPLLSHSRRRLRPGHRPNKSQPKGGRCNSGDPAHSLVDPGLQTTTNATDPTSWCNSGCGVIRVRRPGGQAAVEGDLEGVEGGFPARGPAFASGAGGVRAHRGHVNAFQRRGFVGEVAAGFDRAADPGVDGLDRGGSRSRGGFRGRRPGTE
jgi:hypothetical protein